MNPQSFQEEKGANAPVKVDNQSYAFLLLRYLQRMDPRMHGYFIYDILVIFFTVDVMLYPRITDWLKPSYGLEGARKIMNHALRSWKNLPLHFEMTKSYGWVVACRSGSNKGPVIAGSGDTRSDDEESDGGDDDDGEAFVEEVEAITEDGLVDGFVLSQIREGDTVQLNSHSPMWWTIYEMRPRKKSILMSRQRITQGPPEPASGDNIEVVTKAVLNGDDDNVDREGCEGGGETGPKPMKQFTKRMVTEYKEVRIDAMFGCLVRREGILNARTIESLERENNCNFDNALMTYAQFEEYSAMLTGTMSNNSKVSKATLKKKNKDEEVDTSAVTMSEKKEFADRRVVVIFKMPLPNVAAAVDRMKGLVAEYPAPPETDDDKVITSGNKVSSAHELMMKDPVWHMQHQAQVKVWVSRWEENLRARQLLGSVDPYLCLHRDKWLLVCKVLRVISRGGEALLPDFISWTKKAGTDGVKRSKDAHSAWASVRPVTTCDLQPLATARAYLRQRGAGHKKGYYDAEGKLRPEAMDSDPQARVVLDAAALYMSHRVLTFFDQSLVAEKPGREVEEDIDGMAVPVVTAIYEYDLKPKDWSSGEAMPVHHIGTFKEERVVSSFITVNDCLMVREPLTGQTQVNNNSQVWVLVLAVDLLFARLRVVQCDPQVPPPYCWAPGNYSPLINSSPCWISIAKLWDVTVCRQLPPSNPDNVSEGLYTIFITPMPSQHEALAVLGHLSDVDIGDALTSPAPASNKGIGGSKDKKFKEYKPNKARIANAKAKQKEKDDAAAMLAEPGTKSRLTGKAKVRGVRFYVDSVILQWDLTLNKRAGPTLKKGDAGVLEKKEVVPEFLVEVAYISDPTGWAPVYRGKGTACQISGLEPLTQYYCRLSTVSHPKISYSTVVACTLGEPNRFVIPQVKKWELGTVKNSVRGLCCVDDCDLPNGCYLQVEASLGDSTSRDHHAADEWVPMARTRSSSVWIVGQFAGSSVVLRTRIINQDSQPGPPGPTGVAMCPTLKEVAESAAGGSKRK
jgi:hypothetical protein